MLHDDLLPYRQNLAFKKKIDLLGLDLAEVFNFTPLDLDMENSRLEHLLDFVKKYQQYGSQETMELVEGGFCFPPIFPGISPRSDWHRFKLWLDGKPTKKKLKDLLPTAYEVKKSEKVSDGELPEAIKKLQSAIQYAGVYAEDMFADDAPLRLFYQSLLQSLEDVQELDDEGGWVLSSCIFFCPGCFQRPWCEFGGNGSWVEDEEAGKMHLIDELKDYVCATPQSLEILKENDEDKEGMKISNPDDGEVRGNEDWEQGVN